MIFRANVLLFIGGRKIDASDANLAFGVQLLLLDIKKAFFLRFLFQFKKDVIVAVEM